jgi:hypothetical protein
MTSITESKSNENQPAEADQIPGSKLLEGVTVLQ